MAELSATFQRTVWSPTIEAKLRKALVYATPTVVNTRYSNDLVDAKTVNIHLVSNQPTESVSGATDKTTIPPRTAAQQLDADDYDTVKAERVTLTVDEYPGQFTKMSLLQDLQTYPDFMAEYSDTIAYNIADHIDQYVGRKIAQETAITDVDRDGTAAYQVNLSSSADTIVDRIMEMKIKMDKANVPSEGRVLVVPPEFTRVIWNELTAKENVFDGTVDADSRLRTGFQGQLFGLNVIQSNNVPNLGNNAAQAVDATDANAGKLLRIIATHPRLNTFAMHSPVRTRMFPSPWGVDDLMQTFTAVAFTELQKGTQVLLVDVVTTA